ncbi:hypothetical protein D9M70_409920 [compost metagenome]
MLLSCGATPALASFRRARARSSALTSNAPEFGSMVYLMSAAARVSVTWLASIPDRLPYSGR